MCGLTAVQSAVYTGKVVDASGAPMLYATVFLQDDPVAGTATGSDGQFVLQTEAAPSSNVIISFIGYEKAELPLSFFADSGAVVTMVEQPIALHETVVEAKKSRQKKFRRNY